MNPARFSPRLPHRFAVGVIAALWCTPSLGAADAQPASSAPPQRNIDADPSKPKRAWRLAVSGDLVCSSLAQRLGEEFNRIKAARAEAVILQLSAVHWRGDIVIQISETIRDAKIPVHIILKPADSGRIGIGSLIAGLSAASLWVTPGSHILGSAADQLATPSLTAKETKAENAELAELIDAGVSRRAAPLEIGPLLLAPTAPRWLTSEQGTTPRIVDDNATSPDAIPIITIENDGVRLRFSDQDALNARLIDGIRGGDSLFKHQRFLHARPKAESALRDESVFTADSTLSCDLDAEYKDVCTALTSIDDAIDRTQKLLDPPGSAKPSSTAKSMADRSLAETKLSLDTLEDRLKSTPELAQRPVPGQSEVGVKSSGWPSKWRSAIQKRRDQVTRLSAKTK
jgi:hypothetical protein